MIYALMVVVGFYAAFQLARAASILVLGRSIDACPVCVTLLFAGITLWGSVYSWILLGAFSASAVWNASGWLKRRNPSLYRRLWFKESAMLFMLIVLFLLVGWSL